MDERKRNTPLCVLLTCYFIHATFGSLNPTVKPKVIALNNALACHSQQRTANMRALWYMDKDSATCDRQTFLTKTHTTFLSHKFTHDAGKRISCKLLERNEMSASACSGEDGAYLTRQNARKGSAMLSNVIAKTNSEPSFQASLLSSISGNHLFLAAIERKEKIGLKFGKEILIEYGDNQGVKIKQYFSHVLFDAIQYIIFSEKQLIDNIESPDEKAALLFTLGDALADALMMDAALPAERSGFAHLDTSAERVDCDAREPRKTKGLTVIMDGAPLGYIGINLLRLLPTSDGGRLKIISHTDKPESKCLKTRFQVKRQCMKNCSLQEDDGAHNTDVSQRKKLIRKQRSIEEQYDKIPDILKPKSLLLIETVLEDKEIMGAVDGISTKFIGSTGSTYAKALAEKFPSGGARIPKSDRFLVQRLRLKSKPAAGCCIGEGTPNMVFAALAAVCLFFRM